MEEGKRDVNGTEASTLWDEVVIAASRLLREKGDAGVGVREVMAQAGLTHGGFYKHFATKDELNGVAAEKAFDGLIEWMEQLAAANSGVEAGRAALLREYLSVQHRDTPGTGCANVGLAADSARAPEDSRLRRSYVEGVKRSLDKLEGAQAISREGSTDGRRRAVFDLAALVGAMALSRATAGDPLSEEILTVVQESLREQG